MEFLILFIQVSFHRQLKRSRLEHARNVGRKVYHTRSLMATNNSGTTSLHNAEARGRKNPNQQQRKTMREALSSRGLEGEALAVSLMELCGGGFWSAGCSARSCHLSNIFTSPCDAKLNCFREVFSPCPPGTNGNGKQKKNGFEISFPRCVMSRDDVANASKRVRNVEWKCFCFLRSSCWVWESLRRN